jgi:hypothetical protein
MTLAELITRARALPRNHPLRMALMQDIYVLLESRTYIESTPGVPGCLSAMLGLQINHLQARLYTCEERVGERQVGGR